MDSLTAIFTKKSGYWQSSRSLAFGLVAILPLLAGYEALALWSNRGQQMQLRNGADVILREMLNWIGIHSPFYIGILIVAIITLALQSRQIRTRLKVPYFFSAIVESMVYALFMVYALIPLTAMLLSISLPAKSLHTELMLAMGAGVYEELVFRAFLFAGSAYALHRILDLQPLTCYLLCAFFSSVLFSIAHYMGGESFRLYSAAFRFLAGLVLCLIYRWRGLGIAAWSHTIYNFLVIF